MTVYATLTPTDNELRAKIQAIIEAVEVPVNENWATLEDNRWIVLGEWPEGFDIGENADTLRSARDEYETEQEGQTITVQRVNAWVISEASFSQEKFPKHDGAGNVVSLRRRPKNVITRSFRIFYFYQFGGVGERAVSDYIEAVRRAINAAPALGFSGNKADMVDGHGGLQMPFEDSGDFVGITAYIRGGQLQVRLIEPLNS